MQGLTIVFHVFSACVILGMTYWIIRIQGLNHFNFRLWRSVSSDPKRVYVDWPESFLDKFTRAIGAKFEIIQKQRGKPCAIKTHYWVRAHVNFSILSIQLDENDILKVQLSEMPMDLDDWQRDLKESISRISSLEIVCNTNS